MVNSWPLRVRAFLSSAEPRAALSRRAFVADGLLALTVVVAALAEVNSGHAGWVSAVVSTTPLAARRSAPLAAFWVMLAGLLLPGDADIHQRTALETIMGGSQITIAGVAATLFTAYSAVVYSRYRGLALLSLPLAGLILTVAFHNSPPTIATLVAIAVFGNVVGVWRARAMDSSARLLQVQAEHEAATRRALELERARIASELHDVVTHNVSVMVVQAGAARQVLGAEQDEARSALLAAEASGRTAMAELQHMLGLLSEPGEPEPDSLADGQVRGHLRPLPGLGQLRTLTNRMTAAGLDVQLRILGAPWTLSPGRDLAAYRVIQEALTNVLKHAGNARTVITLDYQPDGLMIEIADDGPAAQPPTHPREPGLPGSGRGLLGLRERVILHGGKFDAGRRPGGGWRVISRFPADEPPLDAVNGAATLPNPAVL